MLLSPIYAITDPILLPGEKLFDGVKLALEAGITTLQYRDKNASDSERFQAANFLLALCNTHRAQLIINDDVHLANRLNAHGVHLGQTDGSVKEARGLLGEAAIIGVTCHNSLELALQAQAEGASYVAFGRFFPSNTKPLADAADVQTLAAAREALTIPIVAIGGIHTGNMQTLINCGAHSVAVCQSVFGMPDIAKASKELINCWNQNHV